MSINDTTTKADITYYGKKVYYLNEDLATRIETEQVRKSFIKEDIEPYRTGILH